MTIPYTVSGSLTFPPEPSAAECVRALQASGTYTQKQDDRYTLTGSGTQNVTFSADLKILLVQVEAGATAAVNVRINTSTDDIEVTAGGFILISNPTPGSGTGILQINLVHTTDAVVRVIGLS